MTDPVIPPIVAEAFLAAGKGMLAHLQRERLEKARQIIVRRLAKGQLWAITDDDAAAALFTYLRAAEEGAARRNLEAIADLLVTSAAEPTFAPNEFRAQARQLADLSRDEALALAILIRAHFNPETAYPASIPGGPRGGFNPWEVATYRVGEASVEAVFKSKAEFWEVCVGLVRTGWVKPVTGSGDGLVYGPTASLAKIARLVDLDAAIARAEAEGVER